MISHWDDVRTWRGERDHIAGTWSSLTGRVSQSVGVKRIQVDPGTWSTPLHLEGAEEEIFYVRRLGRLGAAGERGRPARTPGPHGATRGPRVPASPTRSEEATTE